MFSKFFIVILTFIFFFYSCASQYLLNVNETENSKNLIGKSGELYIKSTDEKGKYKEEKIDVTIVNISEVSIYTVNNSNLLVNYHLPTVRKFIYVDTEQGMHDGLNVGIPIIGIPILFEYLIDGKGWSLIFFVPFGIVLFTVIAASSHTYTVYFQ